MYAPRTGSRKVWLASFLLWLAPAVAFAQAEGCTGNIWNELANYVRGDIVWYADHEWIAKRNSHGVVPGTHTPTWRDLGICGSEPPTEPPDPPPGGDPGPLQIFGVWHAGNHYADWAIKRDMVEFDEANGWLIRGANGEPAVNLVVLSFLQPMQVLNMDTADPTTGVPAGMTQEVVDYFKNEQIVVMMSIGGVTYTDYWDEALATNATQLGLNAAAIADYFGVGIEIDYERNTDANLAGLDTFIAAYRSAHPFNPENPEAMARLTIDLAAGGRYLQELNRHATLNWLDPADRKLDWANAMVHRSSGTPDNWQEHIDGKLQYDPPIPPKAPRSFTGGLYLKGNMANCLDFDASEQWAHAAYVQTVLPNGAGSTPGMLGYMFWAAETPSARKNYTSTVPPNSCEHGMGPSIEALGVEFPMPVLPVE